MKPHSKTFTFTVPADEHARLEHAYSAYQDAVAELSTHQRNADGLRKLALARREVARAYEALADYFLTSRPLFSALLDKVLRFDQQATEDDRAALDFENGGEA